MSYELLAAFLPRSTGQERRLVCLETSSGKYYYAIHLSLIGNLYTPIERTSFRAGHGYLEMHQSASLMGHRFICWRYILLHTGAGSPKMIKTAYSSFRR
jgi:hypothetical protein